ncbi:glycoside hydrolase family 2 [Pontibacter sp. 172403-2]|uniref:glycoside hydrolase family 2 protein n=1 Tax=Pontibacter rufus TaxID=2791028 RepID=UPI0018AFEAB1|nr:glycoside hydrolase family 2 TIM barrel-domain containing protein [Pontibacter sp. 172403-2]MBF9252710.1 glycoside hydrolase family 2 [Pontibacter sp. 172403-2]
MQKVIRRKVQCLLMLLLLFTAIPGALAQNQSHKTQVRYLSGIDKDHRVAWDFKIDKGRRSGKWATIPVPSNWELEGFGVYTYGHEWRKLLPEADATGTYRYKFAVPSGWKNKVTEIVFEGAMTDTEVFVNGKKAGPTHQGGFYRFKYDISDLLKYGQQNQLEVKVRNVSANESVNKAERDADFWVFGGIYRPVYLEAKPRDFIDRIAIDAKADGSFLVDVYPGNIRKAAVIEAQIYTLGNQPVGDAFRASADNKSAKVTLKQQIKTPRLWSPEFPNLYEVEVRLKDKTGMLHVLREKFGFRTVELRARDGFYVNGQKIKFRGVNRHSFWPTSGRTLSKELSILDVNLMKDMNMNAVRMSHYPPDQHFLDVCDSLGLFVLDELTGWQDAYDTAVGRKLVKELVVRDVNHPSVVIWDNGNEGGNNYDLIDDYALYDPQHRTVIQPWNTLGETNTFHYPDFNYVADVLSKGDKVYFSTEFMHGLYDGGHGAGLEDFWNLMQRSQLSAGGFLWAFSDEGVVRTDEGGSIDVKGTLAPDGILGPYREKEGSFYTIKEIWSPVYINQPYITPKFDGRLQVENRYHFTNLNQCTFTWRLLRFPKPDDQVTDSTVVAAGSVAMPAVEPGLTGYMHLNLPDGWQNSDALYLTATDPHGRHILTWTWPVRTPEQIAASVVDTASLQAASGREDDQYIYVSANGVEVKFSKENGLIAGVQNAITPVSFGNGPKLTVDNSKFKSIRHYQQGNDHVVALEYEGPISQLYYRMMGSGWLQLDYTYYLYGDYEYMGVTFSYPEEKVKGVKWLGEGPYRVWKNRMKGPQFAVHQKDYNNTATGRGWDYPEFKGYHDRMFWAVIDNEEYPITVVSATDHIFMRLFTPKPSENETSNAAFPAGDISFMDAISAVGTKFQKAEQLSPQGGKNQFRNHHDRQRLWGATLYFDFGAGVKKAARGTH